MDKETYAERIRENLLSGDRSYHSLFPIVRELRTKEDTREFMEGYVEVMKEVIKRGFERGERNDRGVDNVMSKLELAFEEAARNLAADNLPLLANTYEACEDRKPQRSWWKVLGEMSSD